MYQFFKRPCGSLWHAASPPGHLTGRVRVDPPRHKGFLVIEAGKPALADALWSFKQAWDAAKLGKYDRCTRQIRSRLFESENVQQKNMKNGCDFCDV